MKKVVLSLIITILCINSIAQVPESFNYQAIPRNASGGEYLSQAMNIKINILSGSPTGSSVYCETFAQTTTSLGLLNLQIGKGSPVFGNFATINWGANSFYLKVEIDPTGGTSYVEMGTTQLLSVPYAMHAKTVANYTENDPVFIAHPANVITGGNISNWNTSYEWGNHAGLYRLNSWVPTWTDITSKPSFATVATSGNYNDLLNLPTLFNGTWTSLTGKPSFSAVATSGSYADLSNKPTIINSQWTTTSSNIYYNAGNVGIGTTTPSYQLHVAGTTRISDALLVDGFIRAGGYPNGSNLGSYNLEVGGPSPTNANGRATIYFYHHLTLAHQLRYTNGVLYLEGAGNGYGTTNTPTLQIGGSLFAAVYGGNVGIGTTNPTSKVVIQPPAGWDDNTPLFDVKNQAGVSVFTVYNNGIRAFVQSNSGKGATKGGFAIGGFDQGKSGNVQLMSVSPDSIRFNIDNGSSKNTKGGFAIGGFDTGKGINQDFLYITPQSSNSGQYNTYLGYHVGKNSSGPHNTYIGVNAGVGLPGNSSASNIFIGEGAGINNSGGYSITQRIGPTGALINVYQSWGGENVAIGNYSGSNIAGISIVPDYGKSNVLIGNYSGFKLNTSSRNVIIGFESGYSLETGDGNVFIGYQAGYSETGSGKLYVANSSAYPPLIYGDFSTRKIGIGRISATNTLEVEGAASKTTAGMWITNSDSRIKTQILDIDNSQEIMLRLHPVKFKYIEAWRKKNPSIQDKFYYNFLAQEFQEVFPESVQGSGEYLEGQPDELLQLDSYNAQIVAIKALQEVIQQNKEQQHQIDSQQKEIDELKALVNNLIANQAGQGNK
jgi:hypothetical protein